MIRSEEAVDVAARRDEVIVSRLGPGLSIATVIEDKGGTYKQVVSDGIDLHVTDKDVWRCYFCKHCPNAASRVKQQLKPDEFTKYLLDVLHECPKQCIAESYKPEDTCHDTKAFAEYAIYNCHGFTRRSDGSEYKEVGAFRRFFSGFFKTKLNGQWRYTCEDGKVNDMFNMLISGVKAPRKAKILPRGVKIGKNTWTMSTRKYDVFTDWKSKHNMMLGSAVLEVIERANLMDVLIGHIQENLVKKFSVLDTVSYLLERDGKTTKCKDLDESANKYLPDDMHDPNAKETLPDDWDESDAAALRDINK